VHVQIPFLTQQKHSITHYASRITLWLSKPPLSRNYIVRAEIQAAKLKGG